MVTLYEEEFLELECKFCGELNEVWIRHCYSPEEGNFSEISGSEYCSGCNNKILDSLDGD